jgi:hypothetical protein
MRSPSTLLAMILLGLSIGACSAAAPPPSSGSSASLGPSVPATGSALPSPEDGTPTRWPSSPTPSPPVLPSPPPSDEAAAPPVTESLVGSVVTTLADDGLRVRSRPSVDADSFLHDPLLPLGSQLYVLDGPVMSDGYAWHEVVPLSSRAHAGGWIASASRDGEPWIAPDTFDCPAAPADLRSLAALPAGVGLVCFPGVPITVDARLIWCNCDADGAWYTPHWFFYGSGSPDLLVDPEVDSVPSDTSDWFVLNLDPAGEHPDPLPLDRLVRVTGTFDHPAAKACTQTEMDGEPKPSMGCRLAFAVTRLILIQP